MTVEFIIERRDGTSSRYATAAIHLECTINQYNPGNGEKYVMEEKSIIVAI